MSMTYVELVKADLRDADDLTGIIPESWHCIDCGFDTAPGCLNRIEMERAIAAAKIAGTWPDEGITQTVNSRSEIYHVRAKVWQAAGMEPWGGCLCVGCIERRLGRTLRPKDFQRGHALNDFQMPATERLLKRRGAPKGAS
jgi:hypothetical protein